MCITGTSTAALTKAHMTALHFSECFFLVLSKFRLVSIVMSLKSNLQGLSRGIAVELITDEMHEAKAHAHS